MIYRRHRQMGVRSSPMQSVINTMPVTGHDLAFDTGRNDIALRAMQRHIDGVVIGHDGSPNMVHGAREHHVIAVEKFRASIPATPS